MNDLHKTEDGKTTPKTKTATIIEKLNDPMYKRGPIPEILKLNKQETRTLIMARYGMLQCGRNFGAKTGKSCDTCSVPDDEEHRLNICPKWMTDDNKNQENVDFTEIYFSDPDSLRKTIKRIESVWNTKTGNGSMITS